MCDCIYYNRSSWKERNRYGFNAYGEDLVGVTRLGYNVYEDRDENLADRTKRAILMPIYRVYYYFNYFVRFMKKISEIFRMALGYLIMMLYGVGFGICEVAKAIGRGIADVFCFVYCLAQAIWDHTWPIRMILKAIIGIAIAMGSMWLLGAAGAILG